MKQNDINKFLYALTANGVKIWVEKAKIKLFVPTKLSVTAQQQNYITQHRSAIVKCLQRSGVISPNYNKLILKNTTTTTELSFAQERLWFMEKYTEGTNIYNVPLCYELMPDIELAILIKSINCVVWRHEILRTVIKEDANGNAYQEMLNQDGKKFTVRQVIIKTHDELLSKLREEVSHRFNLSGDYTIRATIYTLLSGETTLSCKQNKNYLCLNVHHIAFDGWSNSILLKELVAHYWRYQNRNIDKLLLPTIFIQYSDFAKWQRDYLSGDVLAKELMFWQSKIAGYETLNLITDKPRPLEINYTGASLAFSLDRELTNQLRGLAKELQVSLYSLLLSAYVLLLRIYSNQNDIVLGTAVANRPYLQVENLIGFFVNTLVLRFKITSNFSIGDFVRAVSQEVIAAQEHQQLPFAKLVEALHVAKDTSRQPIFQVTFGMQSFVGDAESSLMKPLAQAQELFNIAKYDLSLFIDDREDVLRGEMNYAVSLYNEETIARFIATYQLIISQLIDFKGKILNIKYLTALQYDVIIQHWNNTACQYSSYKTIQEFFEAQVNANPNKIAVVYGEQTLTYEQLNARVNQLAHYLRKIYRKQTASALLRDTAIALCAMRSIEMLVGILAILKAGGAYVPIDPDYPATRIKQIINDSNAQIVLTDQDGLVKLVGIYRPKKGFYDIEQIDPNSLVLQREINQNVQSIETIIPIVLDSNATQLLLNKEMIANPVINVDGDSLAYILYTSGTSGNPKGVMIEHQNVINHMLWMQHEFHLNEQDCFFNKTPFVFDASVWEILLPLFIGGTLVIASHYGHKDPAYLWYEMDKHQVTVVQFVPTLFFSLLESGFAIEKLAALRLLFCGGEALNVDATWLNRQKFSLINLYGPTETTIDATFYRYVQNTTLKKIALPIGKPVANTTVYVLNDDLQPVPIGAVGMLFIGGKQVGRGYLNQEQLTAEHFIANPYSLGTIYKTGDLVRWQADGNLEYISRSDFQVKVRGFRIELSEIEVVLQAFPGIKQAVMAVQILAKCDSEVANNNKYLVGYYVADKPLVDEQIFAYLKAKLPTYMVPTFLIYLPKLPLTVNGKLNRVALPLPTVAITDAYVAPSSLLEQQIAKVWQDCLHIDRVGIHDDFFSIGGNSIVAMQVSYRLGELFQQHVKVAELFRYKTIKELAENLGDKKTAVIIPRLVGKDAPLSFAQERLWFIEKYTNSSNVYNIPMLYELALEVDVNILVQSLQCVVARQAILRTVIREDSNGIAYQQVLNQPNEQFTVRHVYLDKQEELIAALSKDVNHVFNLAQGYPIVATIYTLREASILKRYLSIVVHHIAFDGWSVNILLRELVAYYRYHQRGETLSLANLPLQYIDFAAWQRQYFSDSVLEHELSYWQHKITGYETLNLITDKPRPSEFNYSGATINFVLDEDISYKLRGLARELKISLYSLLLSAYLLLLRIYSGQDDIVLGMPIANRSYMQLENLIGFFVNILVLRFRIDIDMNIQDYVLAISQEVKDAQVHQELPLEKLVDVLNIPKDLSRHPIFQTIFSLHGFAKNEAGQLFKPFSTEQELLEVAKFDLSLFIDDSGSILQGSMNYATSLYNEDTIVRFIATYKLIISQLIDFKGKILDIKYLTASQYDLIIKHWNNTCNVCQCYKTIQELFEEQVQKTPEQIAVTFANNSVSYLELNRRANKLAHYLRRIYKQTTHHDLAQDVIIAICAERGIAMIVGILAIIKAGGAYLPIDYDYPSTRIQYMLDDAEVKIMLVTSLLFANPLIAAVNAQNKYKIILITDDMELSFCSHCSPANPHNNNKFCDLAYVNYTSGSTGQPKGVLIEHRAVVNLVKESNFLQLTALDTVGQFANYAFDAFTLEIWGALLNGAGLVILSKEIILSVQDFHAALIKYHVNVAFFTTSLFNYLVENNIAALLCLRAVLFGGEAANVKCVQKMLRCKPQDLQLINGYGPTECTTFSHYCLVTEQYLDAGTIPIGKPLTNKVGYVLDKTMQPVPVGAVGELYLGGDGIARGYLHNDDLTRARFVVNPFTDSTGMNEQSYQHYLYKTQDLVRWLPDGNLVFVGRVDNQVKIRGHRIELGEIEQIMLQCPAVKECAVILHEVADTTENIVDKKIAAYYVPVPNIAAISAQPVIFLQQFLASRLPSYMLPTYFVATTVLPLTANGKLDKQALPPPTVTSCNQKTDSDHLTPGIL